MLTQGSYEKAKLYVKTHDKDLGKTKIKSGVCVTISRESGAGADKVSQQLLNFFEKRHIDNTPHWTVFDRNLIDKVLEDHNLPQRLSEVLQEKKVSIVSSMMNEWLSGEPSTWNLIHKTTQTILQIGKSGNAIIIGRGGNIITRKLPNAFHVRLVAPLEKRINHVKELYNFNSDDAVNFIKEEDFARRRYLLSTFGKNIEDTLYYDLIVNTSSFGYDGSAEIIGRAIIKKFPSSFAEFS